MSALQQVFEYWPVVAFGAACLMVVWALIILRDEAQRRDRAQDLPPPAWRYVWHFVGLVSVLCRPLMNQRFRRRYSLRLRAAGLEFAVLPEEWLAGSVLLSAAGSFMGVLVVAGAGGSLFVGALLGGLLGAVLPEGSLADRIRARRRAMARQLPFLLDLMTLSVESGMNPPAALAMAVSNAPAGAMRDELARVLRDVRAGRARQEAFRLLAERTAIPGVASFVAAMLSAEQQGLSLAPLLRAQAEQRRDERFLLAERRAMEAPVKLLLPLVLFIFPGTFAVLLFPVVMQMLDQGLF